MSRDWRRKQPSRWGGGTVGGVGVLNSLGDVILPPGNRQKEGWFEIIWRSKGSSMKTYMSRLILSCEAKFLDCRISLSSSGETLRI